MPGLGLVHSLYRAHRAVVPATAWHILYVHNMFSFRLSANNNQRVIMANCANAAIAVDEMPPHQLEFVQFND